MARMRSVPLWLTFCLIRVMKHHLCHVHVNKTIMRSNATNFSQLPRTPANKFWFHSFK